MSKATLHSRCDPAGTDPPSLDPPGNFEQLLRLQILNLKEACKKYIAPNTEKLSQLKNPNTQNFKIFIPPHDRNLEIKLRCLEIKLKAYFQQKVRLPVIEFIFIIKTRDLKG